MCDSYIECFMQLGLQQHNLTFNSHSEFTCIIISYTYYHGCGFHGTMLCLCMVELVQNI